MFIMTDNSMIWEGEFSELIINVFFAVHAKHATLSNNVNEVYFYYGKTL